MADYSGYFLQGLAGGIQTGMNMGTQLQEMRWQKKQRKALEEKQAKMLEVTDIWNAQIIEFAPGGFSDDEITKLTTTFLSGGYEFTEHYQGAMNAIKSMNERAYKQELEWMDLFIEGVKGLPPGDIESAYEFVKPYIKSEKGLNQLEAYNNFLKKRSEITPTLEVFPSAEALKEKYPKAGVKYTDEGYVPTFAEPTVKAPTAADRKLDWAIDSYNEGKISFNELSKYMGTYIAPEEMSAKEKEIELAKQYGATNEEIKNKLLGISVGPEPTPAPTSTENVRGAIFDADTLEDAQRIYKNYADKYDETALGITDLKGEWTDNQISYLSNIFDTINKSIKYLIDEKGHLRKGTVTQEEIGVEFKGEQPIEEIYKLLKEEYTKYRDMLEKLGVDVNQYPKLKSLEEIEKVGFWEGFWGFGKQRGQYKSIYK